MPLCSGEESPHGSVLSALCCRQVTPWIPGLSLHRSQINTWRKESRHIHSAGFVCFARSKTTHLLRPHPDSRLSLKLSKLLFCLFEARVAHEQVMDLYGPYTDQSIIDQFIAQQRSARSTTGFSAAEYPLLTASWQQALLTWEQVNAQERGLRSEMYAAKILCRVVVVIWGAGYLEILLLVLWGGSRCSSVQLTGALSLRQLSVMRKCYCTSVEASCIWLPGIHFWEGTLGQCCSLTHCLWVLLS